MNSQRIFGVMAKFDILFAYERKTRCQFPLLCGSQLSEKLKAGKNQIQF